MTRCVCGLYDDQPCSREVCRRPVLGRYTPLTELELVTRPRRDAERIAKLYAIGPYAYQTVESVLGH